MNIAGFVYTTDRVGFTGFALSGNYWKLGDSGVTVGTWSCALNKYAQPGFVKAVGLTLFVTPEFIPGGSGYCGAGEYHRHGSYKAACCFHMH